MFSSEEARRRFLLAFVVAWIIAVALGSVASGIVRVLAANAITALATGQWMDADDSLATFLRAFADIPPLAMFTALETVVSLIIAKMLSARHPQWRYFAYAVGGAIPPFVFGLIPSFVFGFYVDWTGMAIGAVALLSAARLVREPEVSANPGQA